MDKVLIYQEHQENPWIVFIHGWGQTKESLLSLLYKCRPFANCLALDLKGAKTNPLEKPYGIANFVDDFKDTLQKYQITPRLFIAHSFGGKIAHFYQEEMGIVPTIYLAPSLWKPRFSLRRYLKIKGYKICRFLKNKKIIKAIPRYFSGSSDYRQATGLNRETFRRVVNVYPNQKIAKYAAKSYLIWGKYDEAISKWQFQKMKKHLRKDHCFVVEGGHFAYQKYKDFIANLAQEIIKEN